MTPILRGRINFTLPSRPDEDPTDPARTWSTLSSEIELHDARQGLNEPVSDQLSRSGWAVTRRPSQWAHLIGTDDGLRRYYRECADIFKAEVQPDQVLIWNSTTRSTNSPPPDTHLDVSAGGSQRPADFAHVDQDETWGAEMIHQASQKSPADFRRSMIVNLWRPLRRSVTAQPLVMLDYRSLLPDHALPNPGPYGTGLRLVHHEGMRWSYLRHQEPEEIVLLKCWDSLSFDHRYPPEVREREAAFGAHAAADVGEQDCLGGKGARVSIEVRMILLWEHQGNELSMHPKVP